MALCFRHHVRSNIENLVAGEDLVWASAMSTLYLLTIMFHVVFVVSLCSLNLALLY